MKYANHREDKEKLRIVYTGALKTGGRLTMRATVERNEALRLLRVEHQAVAALIDALSDEEMTRQDTIRHGLYSDQQCSFKDLLAHLVCYEQYSLEAIDAWQAGRKHWVIDALRDPAQSREIHYGGIAERAGLSLEQQLAEYRRVSAALEAAIESLDDAAWHGPAGPSESGDLGGMIELIMVAPPRPMYRHLPVHVPDARRYIRSLR